jgi:chemosensory pili system protein ChpB (putative protein-glutamate methylesterase)
MAETPAVALLFEDIALGDQLRNALLERGARIVHEGGLSELSRERVLELGADVLVVNLDDDNDDALDRLCDVIEGDRPRVVFNDAQASRKLDGWDRARWARHLAVKVLSMGDVDPPRPADAAPVPMFVPPEGDAQAMPDREITTGEAAAGVAGGPSHEQTVAASETLAAELEALLAAGDLAEDANEFGDGLNYAAGADEPLNDGHFGHGHVAASPDHGMQTTDTRPGSDAEVLPGGGDVERDDFARASERDDLALVPVEAAETPTATEPAEQGQAEPAVASVRLSDSWSLLEEGDVPLAAPSPVASAGPAAFGIEKVSAADYLAPDTGGADESPIVLGMSLELVSMEEAIAPRDFDSSESRPNEMMLGELTGALGRLVVLGATTESTQSVCEFLSALPADLRLTFLHTQHLAGKPADALVEHLAEHCALPVRLAEPGRRAQIGEVLVVPSDRQIHLLRDGSIRSEPIPDGSSQAPSIDSSFTMAASVFGRDAVAIVFAGHSTDAFGGCQAVHDRGGQVWVEAGTGEHVADMVSAVMAERLSHYSGTPQQLAAHLVEEYSKEGRP